MQLMFGQTSSDIRVNQIGFYPSMPKMAVVRNSGSAPFSIVSTVSSDTVFRGTLTPVQTWSYSKESVSLADFSDLRTVGNFTVAVPGVGTSYPFEIKNHVHEKLAIGTVKGYYYQRASTALISPYAGTWARAAGHPDTIVLIHPSAATPLRPANTVISTPKGWYDAGDYNEYIVNSGISTYTLLATYEHFPEFSSQLTTNIPESGNGVPDILDEALWNIRWMLSMQDPNDGGVYSKLTNANFDAFIMPSQATTTRYVVKKSTCATLDFAAVMAQAARITAKFSTALPGLSDSCLQASLKAWKWARQNPTVYYNQTQMNALYSPAINTGEYGDNNASDEFAWAAAELFVTTVQDSFLTVANPLSALSASIPSWPNVRSLGLYTFAQYRATIAGSVETTAVRSRLISLANALRTSMNASAYKVVMGYQSSDFVWGSNGVAANQGMELLIAYKLTGDSTYLRAALSNLDYLLGRNGTSYCFVTDFGSHSPLHIHHRASSADGIAAPVPGLLAGGPNPGMEDGVGTYPSPLPALAYTDDMNAYACNEIAINWNAPLVYLAVGLEALLSPNGLPTSVNHGHVERPTPDAFGLFQNYPNPFNPETTILYRIPFDGRVKIAVYDVLGRDVQTLFEGLQQAGNHEVRFDASDIASGVYFYRLSAQSIGKESYTSIKKMVVLK
jgi:endoglucanase